MDWDSYRTRVGLNLRRARWLAGLTQEEAAARAKLSYRYFREMETGRRNPTLEVLHGVAETLGVRVSQIVDVEPGRVPKRLRDLPAEPPPKGRRPKKSRRRSST